MFFVYILESKDKSFYTGITGNLSKKIKEHIAGQLPFTKNKRPVRLVYYAEYLTRQAAAEREKEIKGWRREKKINLFQTDSLH